LRQAWGDGASTAETDDTARLGLEALRDGHVQELTALREEYVAEVAAEEADEVDRGCPHLTVAGPAGSVAARARVYSVNVGEGESWNGWVRTTNENR
jgi:hypothetical protein